MLNGFLHLSIWGKIIALLITTHITVVATTIYLHRSQAHRALDLHPIASHFFRFWLWLTTGTKTKEWVSIHRKHHAKCETPDDPHSPQVLGIHKVFFQGYELYKKETFNQDTMDRYGHGTPDDWLERHLYSRRHLWGIAILFLVDIFLFGVLGITVWALQMIWIPVFAAGVINGIGHYWGYRNYECPDHAKNIVPWSILTAGEELHNNHHTFATSAKLSVKWWEFDLGWCYIRMLSWLGLAKVKRLPAKLIEENEKLNIDLDTLAALISNRFQVLTQYSKTVIIPILKQEQAKATLATRKALRHCKSLLISADILLDDAGKQKIAHVLENNQALQLVYQYRQRLQAIWNKTTGSNKELLEALQQWCKEAEATGVQALQSFAVRVRGYAMPK